MSALTVTMYHVILESRFFGSRYDSVFNLFDSTNISANDNVVKHLTNLATTVAQTLLDISKPLESMDISSVEADSEVVVHLLECFLVQTNCSLLKTVLVPGMRTSLGELHDLCIWLAKMTLLALSCVCCAHRP